MYDHYDFNDSRLFNSRTPAPLSKSPPFSSILNSNNSDMRDNMQRLYKVPGHSYLTPWGNEKTVGKATPKRITNKVDLNLMVSDIEGAQKKRNRSHNPDIYRSLDDRASLLPEIKKPYFPRKNLMNEINISPPSPERSRMMGLLEQLQCPKPIYLGVRRKYAAPNKHGSPIKPFIEEKLTPKIGSKWN